MKMKNTANRDTAWYGARTASLAEFMTPERNEVLRRTVAMRTRYMTVLAENMFHGQNAAALIRHCEAFGIQEMLVFLVCTLFDDNAAVHVDAALRIVFLRMRRVEGMCIVSRNKEASRKISVICNRVFSTGCIDMLQCLCQERRIRTLLCEASYLLIVKDCADIDLACRLCNKKAL